MLGEPVPRSVQQAKQQSAQAACRGAQMTGRMRRAQHPAGPGWDHRWGLVLSFGCKERVWDTQKAGCSERDPDCRFSEDPQNVLGTLGRRGTWDEGDPGTKGALSPGWGADRAVLGTDSFLWAEVSPTTGVPCEARGPVHRAFRGPEGAPLGWGGAHRPQKCRME